MAKYITTAVSNAQFLKYGNKRGGESGDNPEMCVPRSRPRACFLVLFRLGMYTRRTGFQ